MKIYKTLILLLLPALLSALTPPKTITWTAIGDSITYLNDHPGETGNRVTKGWLTRVTESIPGLRYTNQGHNGWKATDIAREIETLGIQSADMYTIFLGTNDWWSGEKLGTLADYTNNTGIGTVNGAFRVIIDKLHSLNPAAHIILITPMQRGDFVYIGGAKNNAWGSYKKKNGQDLEDFADAVKAIGKSTGIPVVDLYHEARLSVRNAVKFKRLKDPQTGAYKDYTYPDYMNIPFNPESDDYPYPKEAMDMTYDGLHPSDKGSAVIAEMVSKEIKHIRF